MDAIKGNRKVVPNYLLEDYVPSSAESKNVSAGTSNSQSASSSAASSSSSALPASANANGVAGGYSSDSSNKDFPFLPRRKKKLRQACIYCRRSHLVCEEKRPCTRCVKRGIADRCADPPGETPGLQEENGSGMNENNPAPSSPPTRQASSTSPGKASGANSTPGPGSKRKRKTQATPAQVSASSLPPFMSSMSAATDADPLTASSLAQNDLKYPATSMSYPATSTHVSSVPISTSMGSQHSSLAAAYPQPTMNPYDGQQRDQQGPLHQQQHQHQHQNQHQNQQQQQQQHFHHSHHHHNDQSQPLTMGQPNTPGAGRTASAHLLQDQPIFQPPSSAELDSLFSSYFFDVADAFSADRLAPQQQQHHQQQQHQQHHPNALQSASIGQMPPPASQPVVPHGVPHQQAQQQPQDHQHVHHPQQDAQHQPSQQTPPPPQRQYSRAQKAYVQAGLSALIKKTPSASASRTDDAASQPPRRADDAAAASADNSNGKGAEKNGDAPNAEGHVRQQPGDVYAPYPYRKGYASLMRYMMEQEWSEESIRSVEAALSKIRKLWFSLEDNIQPSSMIQLQAEWAGNVRYYSESVLPFSPVPMVVCRKAGEVYAANQLAQDLCGRTRDQMTGGKISCYELMTEESAARFFRLYEIAVGGTQGRDGQYIPTVGNTTPLYWNADIVSLKTDDSATKHIVPTRGVFEMKIAPCGLPSLLVCCFVPLH